MRFDLFPSNKHMSDLNGTVHKLRKEIFSGEWPLDEEIREVSASVGSHSFLANPAGQYCLVYLTRFVRALSEVHFRRPFSDLNVLDWGCGKGQVSKLIRDLAPKNIESCDLLAGGGDSTFGQETPIIKKFNIHVTPLQHEYILPYDSESFDVFLSVGVLEHVANERESLREVARVLKPGGLFFCFYLPTRFSWTQQVARWKGDDYHNRLYAPQRVLEMNQEAGLQILDMWYRQILPKNTVHYPNFRFFEKLDLFFTEWTPLRYLATNIEFVSAKAKTAK